MTINYKYHEDEILQEVQKYIDSTYDAHYAGDDEIQALDAVIAAGNGWGFVLGNIQKYSFRGPHKGKLEEDLKKIIHYAIFALHLAKRDAAKQSPAKSVEDYMKEIVTVTLPYRPIDYVDAVPQVSFTIDEQEDNLIYDESGYITGKVG